MDDFATKTSPDQKQAIDAAVARFFYACAIPFNVADHPLFRAMVATLRPGYSAPSRKDIAGKHLDEVHGEVMNQTKDTLHGKRVTLIQDGWSDIHNNPVIANVVHTGSSTHYVSSIETGSNTKSADYCTTVAVDAMEAIEKEYECSVVAMVTDNEPKMDAMKRKLKEIDPKLITVGCSSHHLNLLGADCTNNTIAKNVVEVNKYFRNHHKPNSLLNHFPGSVKPILPGATRWNSQIDCFRSFVTNRPHMCAIVNDDNNNIETRIANLVNNIALISEVKHQISQLQPIAVALDRAQSDTCGLADTCEDWLSLLNNPDLSHYQNKVKARFSKAMTDAHFLANLLHPRYIGGNLTADQKSAARDLLEHYSSEHATLQLKMQTKAAPFPKTLFTETSISMSPTTWYRCLLSDVHSDDVKAFCETAQLYLSIPASSASIERVFSNYAALQTKVRNRLGLAKAGKLVACYRSLRGKSIDIEDW